MSEQTERLIALVILMSVLPPSWRWLKAKLSDPGEEKAKMRYILAKKLGRSVSKLTRKRAQQAHGRATQ